MTKRRLERDIEELTESFLGDLDADERLGHALEAHATGRPEWVDTLIETTPWWAGRCRDPQVSRTFRLAQLLAQRAVYDLTTLQLRHALRQRENWLRREETPTSDADGGPPETALADPYDVLLRLHIRYHVYATFAEETLGVDLSTWLSIVPDGATIATETADLVASPEPPSKRPSKSVCRRSARRKRPPPPTLSRPMSPNSRNYGPRSHSGQPVGRLRTKQDGAAQSVHSKRGPVTPIPPRMQCRGMAVRDNPWVIPALLDHRHVTLAVRVQVRRCVRCNRVALFGGGYFTCGDSE